MALMAWVWICQTANNRRRVKMKEHYKDIVIWILLVILITVCCVDIFEEHKSNQLKERIFTQEMGQMHSKSGSR